MDAGKDVADNRAAFVSDQQKRVRCPHCRSEGLLEPVPPWHEGGREAEHETEHLIGIVGRGGPQDPGFGSPSRRSAPIAFSRSVVIQKSGMEALRKLP